MSHWLDAYMYGTRYQEAKDDSDPELYCKCSTPKRKKATVAIFRASTPEDDYEICTECKKEVKQREFPLDRGFYF